MATEPAPGTYGMMGMFDSDKALLDAVRRAREAGYQHMDAFTPIPIEGLSDLLDRPRTRVPLIALVGAVCGCVIGFGTQLFATAYHYPLNIGGRPLNSWPAFIPITFELTVLGTALSCFFGWMVINRLPHPHHPVFEVPAFSRASIDRFILLIESRDPKFSPVETRRFMENLKPAGGVHEVSC
jgi:hypothetical protein